MTNNLDTLSLDNLINPNILNDETNLAPVIVIIPPGAQTDNIFEKEVVSIEQQALKLRFIQELNEAAEKKNKELGLPKKNNETNLETDQNLKQDKAHKDHLTKFFHLRPCTTKGAVKVAYHLYHIFFEFGASIILHSDKGLEFIGLSIFSPLN